MNQNIQIQNSSEGNQNDIDIINEEMNNINKGNNININNNIINNNNYYNDNSSKTSFKLSLSNQSQIEIPISQFNPSQFSFKPKSNNSLSLSNNNNSFSQYITPQKKDNKNEFEKMLTVEKLRVALAAPPLTNSKNEKNFHFQTEVKQFPKYPEFKKVTYDDLPELEIMILDDIDKKGFNIYENINFPSIEEIAEIMKNKNIKEEDFDYFSSISYLLFTKRKDLSPNQRQILLRNIPFNTINDFFVNNQSYLNINDINSILNFSSSQAPSFFIPAKDINTLCMVLNIIIFCIQSDDDMKLFIEHFGKDEVIFFIDNLCYLFQKIDHFRLQRKILGLFTIFFQYSDEIILYRFRKIETIIDNINISSNIIIKLQQIMRNKQKKYINLIISNKSEIEDKIKNNDVERIGYVIRFLTFIISGSQGNCIFEEKDYISLLKFFRDLNLKNQKLDEYLLQLKIKIKRYV